MDLAATSAGPWLVLGAVLGVLVSGLVALAVVAARRSGSGSGSGRASASPPAPSPGTGWAEDDLPGFLEHPPGSAQAHPAPATGGPAVRLSAGPALVGAGSPRRPPAPISTVAGEGPGRVLLGLCVAALLLVGIAAVLAVVEGATRRAASGTASEPAAAPGPASPSWTAPDVSGVPVDASPGDPGAGRLAASSVPVGPDGALARATFGGLVLERRAVGVTVAYPVVSVTASEVPGGPALAHLRLPAWNCLTDRAPDDPAAAGCRQLPTRHAELGTPELTVSSDGDGLRISGRFPTYLDPAGSPPAWTGEAYPLAVTWTADGATVHLGTERATALDDPRVTDLETGR